LVAAAVVLIVWQAFQAALVVAELIQLLLLLAGHQVKVMLVVYLQAVLLLPLEEVVAPVLLVRMAMETQIAAQGV
jgi:hypothetical protein